MQFTRIVITGGVTRVAPVVADRVVLGSHVGPRHALLCDESPDFDVDVGCNLGDDRDPCMAWQSPAKVVADRRQLGRPGYTPGVQPK
jgi:hypothetical protein